MTTKATCIEKYKQYMQTSTGRRLQKDFLEFAQIPKLHLYKLFGRDPYTKLQKECGDEPNKLELERTPIAKIMTQYGDLALEVGGLPNGSDWTGAGFSPSVGGLLKSPHFINWGNFPGKFEDWVKKEQVEGYEKVLEWISASAPKQQARAAKLDQEFESLVSSIRSWSPALRRNNEESYKIEIRKHLESLQYVINEEYGESNCDLVVSKKHVIETKKDPTLAEYDRLFGQIARHLQHHKNVIALIFDAPREDRFRNFCLLVDTYLSKTGESVVVIKK